MRNLRAEFSRAQDSRKGMKNAVKIVLLCLLAFTAGSCSSENGESHGNGQQGGNNGGDTGGSYEWEKHLPSYPDEKGTKVTLEADASKDAYVLIRSKGYNPSESPDLCAGNHGYGTTLRHITQEKDGFLKKDVFVFHIHADRDNDRGIATITDRQRNEIKTDAGSPANLRGNFGDTHHYRWKFRLPEDFGPTTGFTHIHQLKGIGGDDISLPIITLTPRYKAKGSTLQVIYHGRYSSSNTYLAEVPLEGFLGHWVVVDQWATYKHEGSYTLRIVRLTDGEPLLQYGPAELDMWRDGATDMRPKYGIYRSIVADNPSVKDEKVCFADFELTQIER